MRYKNFIIPSIDILDGNIVRLYKGDYEQKTIYPIDIVELIELYQDFDNLHIVDLNGAKGDGQKNLDLISRIRCLFSGKIQLGGGVRSLQNANIAINNIGLERVVLGTIAITDPYSTIDIINNIGSKNIVLAIDCKLIKDVWVPMYNGWQKQGFKTASLFDLIQTYEEFDPIFLVTDINTDGTMSGSNFALYEQIRVKFPNIKIQASGGVSSLEDILKLESIVNYTIVGKALYGILLNDIKQAC